MDEIPEPVVTSLNLPPTIGAIRERLEPYYARVFSETYEKRFQQTLAAKIAWFKELSKAKTGDNLGFELIG